MEEPTGASKEAIEAHYGLSNEFFSQWLDSTLTYSCALWDGADSLEKAQRDKLDAHILQSRASGAGRVLDVGCGWGSLLKRLVDKHGVRHAVGLTLTENQAQYVAGLQDPRIEARLENWAAHSPVEPYDAIISIGAFEHFARPEDSSRQKVAAYRAFFEKCRGWLRPGGRLSLQTIALGTVEHMDSFFHSVFPETELPSLPEILEACEPFFELRLIRNDREDYARTCGVWLDRLLAKEADCVELVGEETVEHYERYLRKCIPAFERGTLLLLRIALRRRDTAD